MQFIDQKGNPITVQKSEFLNVVFVNGKFIVPDDWLGAFMSTGTAGDVNWEPLYGPSAITENFLAGDSIARPKVIFQSGTTATNLRLWK